MLLLAAAVVVDRAGVSGSSDAAPASQRYALAVGQLELQREVLETAADIDLETDRLRDAWDRVRPGLVSARTIELAPAALRDRVQRELTGAGIRDLRVLDEEVRGERPEGASVAPVPMRIRVSFDTEDSETLYRAIERIEQSRTLLARVGEVSLRGGGLNDADQRITATLAIDTVVLIGEEG